MTRTIMLSIAVVTTGWCEAAPAAVLVVMYQVSGYCTPSHPRALSTNTSSYVACSMTASVIFCRDIEGGREGERGREKGVNFSSKENRKTKKKRAPPLRERKGSTGHP